MEKKGGGYQLAPNEYIMVRVKSEQAEPTLKLKGPLFVCVLDQRWGVIHIYTDRRGGRWMDAPDFESAVQVEQDSNPQ